MGVTAAILTSPLRCVPRNGSLEAAEPNSNPGRSLPAGNLHATRLLQPRGTFTTPGQHSSMAAKGFKDKSAQGLAPTRTARSQAHMPWGSRSHPGASISSRSWRKVIWQRPSKARAKPQEAQSQPPVMRAGMTTLSLNSAGLSPHPTGQGLALANHFTAPGLHVTEAHLSLLCVVQGKIRSTVKSFTEEQASGQTSVSSSHPKCLAHGPGTWVTEQGWKSAITASIVQVYQPSGTNHGPTRPTLVS